MSRREDFEGIAAVVVSGDGDLSELIPLLRSMEQELYARGIDRIDFDGLPEEEIAIQVSSEKLMELNTSLDPLANEIRQRSSNAPAGTIGRGQAEMHLRSLDQKRGESEFEQMDVAVQSGGRLTRHPPGGNSHSGKASQTWLGATKQRRQDGD